MDDFDTLVRAAASANVCDAVYDGFNRPTQVRTRRKTDLIVASATFLLQRRQFVEISAHEIADCAGCSITSLYKRFVSKDALIPAVHLVTLENYRPILTRELKFTDFYRENLYAFTQQYVNVAAEYFIDNANFVSAASQAYSLVVDRQFMDVIDEYAHRLSYIISAIIDVPEDELISSVRFAILRITDTFRSATLFTGSVSHVDLGSLARLFVLIVEERERLDA